MTIMPKRTKNPMQSGTKLALTITAVAILAGVTIKVVRAANKKQQVEATP